MAAVSENPFISDKFMRTNRNAETGAWGQIRSQTPFHIISSEPLSIWFGQKMPIDVRALKNPRSCLV